MPKFCSTNRSAAIEDEAKPRFMTDFRKIYFPKKNNFPTAKSPIIFNFQLSIQSMQIRVQKNIFRVQISPHRIPLPIHHQLAPLHPSRGIAQEIDADIGELPKNCMVSEYSKKAGDN